MIAAMLAYGAGWWQDTGWTAVQVQNYGGHRRRAVQHIEIRDRVTAFAAHDLVLQEHDANASVRDSDLGDFHVGVDEAIGGERTGVAVIA